VKPFDQRADDQDDRRRDEAGPEMRVVGDHV
jgi:hypothetical protein